MTWRKGNGWVAVDTVFAATVSADVAGYRTIPPWEVRVDSGTLAGGDTVDFTSVLSPSVLPDNGSIGFFRADTLFVVAVGDRGKRTPPAKLYLRIGIAR